MTEAIPDDAPEAALPAPRSVPSSQPPAAGGGRPAWQNAPVDPVLEGEAPPGAGFERFDAERNAGWRVDSGGRGSLDAAASRIGQVVGATERHVRRGLQLVRHPRAAVGEAEKASRQAAQLGRQLIDRYANREQREQWKQRALDRLGELRRRANRMADEHPLETVGAVAAVGFVAGLALRLRRSQHG